MRKGFHIFLSGWLATTLWLTATAAVAQQPKTNAPHHLQWEQTIRAFEATDRTNPPPRGAVLFIGSSSIRLWTNAPAQFPKHRIINRGFGGSHLADSVAFVDRIVVPYQPKAIVLYAGDNDIAAGVTPQQVSADFREFVAKVHAALPQTPIAYIAIKPSPSRMNYFAGAQEANRLIAGFIAQDPKLRYVDVFTPTLGTDGQPRAELSRGDRLHLNDAGYQLWAELVGPVLDAMTSAPESR